MKQIDYEAWNYQEKVCGGATIFTITCGRTIICNNYNFVSPFALLIA